MDELQTELQNCNPGDTVKMEVCVPQNSGEYSEPQEVTTVLGLSLIHILQMLFLWMLSRQMIR